MGSRAQTSKVIPNVKSETKAFVHFIGTLRMKKGTVFGVSRRKVDREYN